MTTILADNIFKCIFLNENDKIAIQISLKLVPRSPIDNKLALVHVMAWCQTGDKPLPEQMMTSSLTHICGTRGIWIKPTSQVVTCCLISLPQAIIWTHADLSC